MKIDSGIYDKNYNDLTEEEKNFLLGSFTMRDLDFLANVFKDSGRIYVNMHIVSKSGTKKISFYTINSENEEPYIMNLNKILKCLYNAEKANDKSSLMHNMNVYLYEKFKRNNKLKFEKLYEPIKSNVCGMDAVFAELYSYSKILESVGYEVSDKMESYKILA